MCVTFVSHQIGVSFQLCSSYCMHAKSQEKWHRSRKNVCLLKIGARSFGNGSQVILRIQGVIWVRLLASKAEITQNRAVFFVSVL